MDVVAIQTHAIVNGSETRRLREVVEIINVNPDGTSVTNTPFKWNPGDDKFYSYGQSKVFEKISIKVGIPLEELRNEFRIRTRLIYALYQNKVLSYEAVQKVVNEYGKDPKTVLQRYGIH